MGGEGEDPEGGAARRDVPPSPEADQKNLWQARATTTMPAKKVVATEDGEGAAGDLTGYVPTGENRRIQESYREWVISNDGAHLSGRDS